ncbi:metallophosphoesterase [bacterium]|nr:MAG: metallophosphoesterase [bacterium]
MRRLARKSTACKSSVLRDAMKFLILSDCHGNKFGLESVLESGREYDQVLCLGDVVGYGAHPNECCEMLRQYNAISLSGNHDAAALGKIDIQWFNPIATAAILWTRNELTEGNRVWLDCLPAEQEFSEAHFQAVHASLRQPWEEYITDQQVALPSLTRMTQPLCFYGHTHVAALASLKGDEVQWRNHVSMQWIEFPDGAEIELEVGERVLINPGSCGQPRDGNPQAKAAIYDSVQRTVEVFGVDYDIEAARDAIIEAGLPVKLGDRLRVGG